MLQVIILHNDSVEYMVEGGLTLFHKILNECHCKITVNDLAHFLQ